MDLLPFKGEPWAHQVEGVKRALENRDFALFFEPGVGKTFTTINILRNVYAREGYQRTLIIAPVVVLENWRREWNQFSAIGHLACVLAGSQKERIETFKKKSVTNPTHIFITNFEALQMKELLQLLVNWRPEIVVCDESQRIKTHDSIRSKMAALLSKNSRHNYILTGTPILNSPLDIFGQYRFLDRGATFGYNFFEFRARYFEDRNAKMPQAKHFPDFRIKKELVDPLTKAIYRKAMRVLKDDCLDLPDIVRVEIPVEMSKEQRRVYDELKRDFVAYLKSGEAVTAQLAIVKALRLQQIATGYATTEMGEQIVFKENPRLKALEDLLVDIVPQEKVIIWACFQENYRQIAALLDKMGIEHTALHGNVGPKDRQKNIDAFQGLSGPRVMIANQAAGGVGVNLTRASAAIFYSRNFSLEQDLQAEARNHRGGSEIHSKITRYDLIARKSIDEIIALALAGKMSLAEQILALKSGL